MKKIKKPSLSSSALKKRLKKIKMLVLDVDGVMTDAKLFFVPNWGWTRLYSVRDGIGIRLLVKKGFQVAVITAGQSQDVVERVKLLGIQHAYYGNEDKLAEYEKLLAVTGLKDEQVAYIGDDWPDLPILKRVGFGATVPDAIERVKQAAHYITQVRGGDGATREVTEAILSLAKP
jgi:3-deoxy-D-manno-octulosonate 8-phosphate phosphatase (KDO 8-P phosphatase)